MEKLTIFLILCCFHAVALAGSKLCSLNGQWFDSSLHDLLMYKVKQIDSKITMDEEVFHPICGEILLEGTTDGKTFNFKLFMSKTDEEYCRTWSEFSGEFTSTGCTKIRGNYTLHWEFDNTHYESTVPFSWYRNIVKIINPSPATELIITAEPKMPEFKAAAILEKPDPLNYLSSMTTINYHSPPFAWNVKIKHSPIPGRLDFDVRSDEVITNDPAFTPNFNLLRTADKHELVDGGVIGGELTLSVDYYKAVRDEKKYIIKGANPGKAAIEQILTDTVTRQIACQESRYKQFEANREGGVGFPVIGRDDNWQPTGGAGIMQIYNPAPTIVQVWNWRKNLDVGLGLLAEKRKAALILPKTELKRLNEGRTKMNLPLCKSLPLLTEEQIQRETLRRYNGGREYRWEPRDDPNCQGAWIVQPTLPEGSDPNYVEKVMACRL